MRICFTGFAMTPKGGSEQPVADTSDILEKMHERRFIGILTHMAYLKMALNVTKPVKCVFNLTGACTQTNVQPVSSNEELRVET